MAERREDFHSNKEKTGSQNIKVSVIVPIYNAEKYLEKCINSIIGQSYPHIEIILVNDGSSDGSLDICRKYQQTDTRINVISQKNQGLVCARKAGLSHARGALVGFVDSDDWIEPDMYEQMIRIYEKFHADLISTGTFREYEDTAKVLEICDNYAEGFYQDLEADIYPTMLRDPAARDFGLYSTLWNKLYVKSKLLPVYEAINTEVFYGEDCMALYPYCLSIDSIYISRKSYYHYTIRDGSMCRKKDEGLLYNTYLLYQALKDAFMEHRQSYILMKQLKRYMLDVETHNLKMLFDIDLHILGKWRFSYERYFDFKIVIYGAGLCGQALYHQICMSQKKYQITAWVDEKYDDRKEQCLYEIESPDILRNLRYDYILIAVMNKEAADQIKGKLKSKYEIDEAVMIWREAEHRPLFDEMI